MIQNENYIIQFHHLSTLVHIFLFFIHSCTWSNERSNSAACIWYNSGRSCLSSLFVEPNTGTCTSAIPATSWYIFNNNGEYLKLFFLDFDFLNTYKFYLIFGGKFYSLHGFLFVFFPFTIKDPRLTVFYDAMEECSQQFFNTTYINQCSCLCARIHITLIPCQKATVKVWKFVHFLIIQFYQFKTLVLKYFVENISSHQDKNGELTCSTPADPTCRLNKIHSCAIAQITDQIQLMNYLACIMTSTHQLPDFTSVGI